MDKKATITIDPNRNYSLSHKNGAKFTSVSFSGNIYGGASPCDNPEEIQSAIDHAIKVIKDHGDIPIILDKRIKQETLF